MITRFYGDVVPPVGGNGIQHLAVEKDVDTALNSGNERAALINGKANGQESAGHHGNSEGAHMLKSGFDIFEFFEHGYDFLA